MRGLLAALLILTALPAQGAERQVWGFVTSDELVQLFYGIPESDGLTLAFICRTKTRQIEVVTSVLPEGPKKGQLRTIILNNGNLSETIDGKLAGDDEDGLHFEATVAAERKVTEILKSGRRLTIRVAGKRQSIPLRGVAKPLAQFEAACFR
jgi:hypothetical protein